MIGWTVSRKGYSTAWTLSCSTPKVERTYRLIKTDPDLFISARSISSLPWGSSSPTKRVKRCLILAGFTSLRPRPRNRSDRLNLVELEVYDRGDKPGLTGFNRQPTAQIATKPMPTKKASYPASCASPEWRAKIYRLRAGSRSFQKCIFAVLF
jgi:hypothetical protein